MPKIFASRLFVYLYRFAGLLVAVAVLLLAIASTPAVAAWLQRGLTGPFQADLNVADYPHAAAIVVLGGGKAAEDGGNDDDSYDSSQTRLSLGRKLLLAHRAPVILLSGGKGEALEMRSQLLALDMLPSRILLEDRSRDTHENAVDSAPILHQLGARSILLVTSSLHMRRAAACFRKLGFNVTAAPSPGFPELDANNGFWRSREHALIRSAYCMHEIFGLWVYEGLGWA